MAYVLVMGYDKGLIEVADGVFAYLQPDGGWGWSNAGLVVGDGHSLLVDTLFDLKLTQDMLDEMEPLIENSPIANLVNTHANGDHCYGNQLVTGAEVITSEASAVEMEELPPAMLAAMMQADFGEVTNAYLKEALGPSPSLASTRRALPEPSPAICCLQPAAGPLS